MSNVKTGDLARIVGDKVHPANNGTMFVVGEQYVHPNYPGNIFWWIEAPSKPLTTLEGFGCGNEIIHDNFCRRIDPIPDDAQDLRLAELPCSDLARELIEKVRV